VTRRVYGKSAPPAGIAPAIALIEPKYPHNVGAAVRAASCFGIGQVWYTGDRVTLDPKGRLPREERMRGYDDVTLIQFDYPFDAFDSVVPVAIEVRKNSIPLPDFYHPPNALYVFGPEDGSLGKSVVRHCHQFVIIPTHHCVNLAAAVYLTLYDRMTKQVAAGIESYPALHENRGFLGEARL
jgi:tRNA(Leu) C34 or U34 (ribose-2'-O)-methylase TrmL